MPYETPTPAQFRTRFPEFASESDDRINMFISDAMRMVDTSWFEGDYQIAILLLAGHYLATSRPGMDGTGAIIQSESFGGEISKSYAVDKDAGSFGGTSYGRRFMEMARRNHPTPFVLGG